MTTSVAELLTHVDELNSPDSPFVFRVEGDRIIGSWDIAHIRHIALVGAGQIDEKYSIDVTLDPETSTHTVAEQQSSGEIKGGFTAGGGFHLSGGTSTFRGSQSRRTSGLVAGTHVTTPDGSGTSATWTFDTDRIKEPLYAFLDQHGWTKKKGFFGRLFGG